MIKKITLSIVLLLVLIQFIPVDRTNPKVDTTISLNADKEVMKILKKSCYDCHSYETKYSIYSKIAPLSFEVASHISKGRAALNFSQYKKIDKEIKKARLKRAIKTINNNMMPLSSYVAFHKEAKLTKQQKEILEKFFNNELKKLK